MGHALHVRIRERARALEHDLDDLLDRQQVLARAVTLHRAARHVLHDDVAGVLADARVVDLRDVRVLELAGERRLGEEQLAEEAPARRVAQRLRKDALDRHLAVAEGVVAQEHLGGGAFAELARDRVVGDVVQARRPRGASSPPRDVPPGCS